VDREAIGRSGEWNEEVRIKARMEEWWGETERRRGNGHGE
jgi:hypothetical protein